jgi:hypothetical protein
LLRRGRFDAIFASNLPNADERAAILDIHLRRRGYKLKDFKADMAAFTEASNGFSGAEIESAVKDGLIEAYSADEDFCMDHIVEQMDEIVPLSRAFERQIAEMTAWAHNNAFAIVVRGSRMATRAAVTSPRFAATRSRIMATELNDIAVYYGKQTFRHESCRIAVFALPTDGRARSFPGSVLEKSGKTQRFPASSDGSASFGYWQMDSFKGKDDVVIMPQVTHTVHGAVSSSAAFLLRLRATGPLISVNCPLRQHRKATFESIPVFQGRADVIPLAEAKEVAALDKAFIRTYLSDEEEVDECFEVRVIAEQITSKPKMKVIASRRGRNKVTVKAPPSRIIRLGGRK